MIVIEKCLAHGLPITAQGALGCDLCGIVVQLAALGLDNAEPQTPRMSETPGDPADCNCDQARELRAELERVTAERNVLRAQIRWRASWARHSRAQTIVNKGAEIDAWDAYEAAVKAARKVKP